MNILMVGPKMALINQIIKNAPQAILISRVCSIIFFLLILLFIIKIINHIRHRKSIKILTGVSLITLFLFGFSLCNLNENKNDCYSAKSDKVSEQQKSGPISSVHKINTIDKF